MLWWSWAGVSSSSSDSLLSKQSLGSPRRYLVLVCFVTFVCVFVTVFEKSYVSLRLVVKTHSSRKVFLLPGHYLPLSTSNQVQSLRFPGTSRQDKSRCKFTCGLSWAVISQRWISLFFLPPSLLSFPSSPMCVVEASLRLVDTYSEGLVFGSHLMWGSFSLDSSLELALSLDFCPPLYETKKT